MNGQFKNIAARPLPLADGRVIGPDDEPFHLDHPDGDPGVEHDQMLEDEGLIARVPPAVQTASRDTADERNAEIRADEREEIAAERAAAAEEPKAAAKTKEKP